MNNHPSVEKTPTTVIHFYRNRSLGTKMNRLVSGQKCSFHWENHHILHLVSLWKTPHTLPLWVGKSHEMILQRTLHRLHGKFPVSYLAVLRPNVYNYYLPVSIEPSLNRDNIDACELSSKDPCDGTSPKVFKASGGLLKWISNYPSFTLLTTSMFVYEALVNHWLDYILLLEHTIN